MLIILAGVTLSTLVSDNGIITKAKEAKQNMTNASREEDELLQNLLNEIKGIEESKGVVLFEKLEWENGEASIEVVTDSNYKIEYKVNDNNWKEIQNNEKITNLKHGDKIIARLNNEGEIIDTINFEVKDDIAPQIKEFSASFINDEHSSLILISDPFDPSQFGCILIKFKIEELESGLLGRCRIEFLDDSNRVLLAKDFTEDSFEGVLHQVSRAVSKMKITVFDNALNRTEKIINVENKTY